jgi:DNA-binding beta-propeller fold protein YncE
MRLRISTILSLTAFAAAVQCATLPSAVTAAGSQPASVAIASPNAALRLVGRTELPAYSGDFDHFAVDLAGKRLFLAGEDQGTVEVFDLVNDRHLQTIKGFDQPHGIVYLPELDRLIVSDSGATMTKIVDAAHYRIIGSIPLTRGADSIRYDASRKHLYVVAGGKNAEPKQPKTIVSEIDPATGRLIGDMTFDTDFTESMAAEQHGHRLFVNLTGQSTMAVVDKPTRNIIARWPIQGAQLNAPMAFDEAHQRLFVGTRKPFKLLVLNAENGATLASFNAPERTNEVVFDEANHRVYLAGDDYLGVIQQIDADHYEQLAPVPTAKGAKTAILVPQLNRLYVAVSPGEGRTGGALLHFELLPGAAAGAIARQ